MEIRQCYQRDSDINRWLLAIIFGEKTVHIRGFVHDRADRAVRERQRERELASTIDIWGRMVMVPTKPGPAKIYDDAEESGPSKVYDDADEAGPAKI
jgi:hypothetical protein